MEQNISHKEYKDLEITIERLRNGYFLYTTIHKGLYIKKLYDQLKDSNKIDFKDYVLEERSKYIWIAY